MCCWPEGTNSNVERFEVLRMSACHLTLLLSPSYHAYAFTMYILSAICLYLTVSILPTTHHYCSAAQLVMGTYRPVNEVVSRELEKWGRWKPMTLFAHEHFRIDHAWVCPEEKIKGKQFTIGGGFVYRVVDTFCLLGWTLFPPPLR